MELPLYERFPDLAARAPRRELAKLPTRVHRLDALSKRFESELWIKRDDESRADLGGSKVRALEFLLPELQSWKRPILACGPEGSGWLLSLARFGPEAGLDLRFLTFPQPHTEFSRRRRDLLVKILGRRLVRGRDPFDFALRFLNEAVRIVGGSAELAPPGGSDAVSVLGYVNAALELAAQVGRGDCPCPDFLYIPLGSGGLAAGLSLGFALARLPIQVRAVSVGPRIVAGLGWTSRLLLQASWMLNLSAPAMGEISVIHRGKGKYGRPTPAGEEARILFRDFEGIALDPSYSSKAAAAMIRQSAEWRGRKVLFWLTYRRPDL